MSRAGTKPQVDVGCVPDCDKVGLGDGEPKALDNTLAWRLRLIWEKRAYLTRAFVAGVTTGVVVAFLIPSRYQSSAQLMPPDSQSGSGLAMLAALTAKTGTGMGAVAGDLLGIKSSGALFVGVLRSRTVEDRLVDKFKLKQVYSVRLDVDARDRLSENTSISEDRKNGIITVTVTDREPWRAASIAQAYVDELNLLVAELSTSSAHRERVFLEDRIRTVKLDLDNASREFSQFSSKNNTPDIKEQARAMVQSAATLEGELIAARSQLKELQTVYTDNNVRVRAAKAQIAELRKQLEKLSGKETPEEDRSSGGSNSSYPSIRKLPLLGVTYADLYRRVQIQEAVYEALTQQYELAKVQEAKETPSVKVLDVASVPEKKSFPPRTLITVFGGLLGLCLGIAVVLMRSSWEDVASDDSRKLLVNEVFETVSRRMPWAEPNGSRVQAATHRVWTRLVPRKKSSDLSRE